VRVPSPQATRLAELMAARNLAARPVAPSVLETTDATAAAIGVLIILVLGSLIATGALNLETFPQFLLATVILAVIAYFARLLGSRHVNADNKRHIIAYIPLFITICAFWAVWFQVYTVATVYFDETVDRTFFGFTVPVAWKDSIQSMWVVLFSGVLAAVWTKMGKRQPKTPLKFALAMLIVGVSYLGFVPYISSGTPMPIFVLMLLLLVITVSELLLSPISLSFATKVAPKAFKTQMVAFNFLTLSLGFTLGGVLGDKLYSDDAATQYFIILAGLSIGSFVVLLLLLPNARQNG